MEAPTEVTPAERTEVINSERIGGGQGVIAEPLMTLGKRERLPEMGLPIMGQT